MTTENLYDIIKSWSVRIHDEGFLMMENEMLIKMDIISLLIQNGFLI